MNVVISQPMLFPWVGIFEQIRLADVYVHYSDVQFSKGSFVNRVQVKTSDGIKWLTIPLKAVSLGQKINEVQINNQKNWRHQHLELLRQAYASTPFLKQMLTLVEQVYSRDYTTIDQLSEASILSISAYFGLDKKCRFIPVQDLHIAGSSSQRVFDIVCALGGTQYITGHGASHYLDHSLFEKAAINVGYMNYNKTAYPQLHGEFTPFVSILDLIANTGPDGERYISSNTTDWKDFIKHE